MAVSTEIYAQMLKAHLHAKGIDQLVCPICANKTWAVTAPIAGLAYEQGTTVLGSSPIIELPAVCRRCKHVLHFAWKAIERGE
jgi:hypothetical protein